jgi:sugar phosphate isomerase/epimerase
MVYNRRKFIRLSSSLAAGIALGSIGCKSSSKTAGAAVGMADPSKAFGIQLYTLRDDMPKDPKGVLKQLSGFGYRQIESYEGPQGMFWGMNNKAFKTWLDDLNMTIVSSHCDYKKDLERKAAEAAAIGMKYLICPWLGPQKTLDDFKKFADEFNKAGATCKKEGIRFAYHNHDYSFVNMEGQIPQDVLMERTDATLVDFEMDYYWVVTAGHSPETWLKKYPNRFKLCHIKDRTKNIPASEKSSSCNLGEGSINYAPIFKTAKENGMEYLIVEQEKYEGTTPIASSEANAKYMMKMLG